MRSEEGEPEAVIGLVADIQYADKVDLIQSNGRVRKYRECISKLEAATEMWNTVEKEIGVRSKFMVLQVGDLVDGYEDSEDEDSGVKKAREDLEKVASVFEKAGYNTRNERSNLLHVVGNHCLSVGWEYLADRLGMKGDWWYSRDLSDNWTLVVLNSMDVSLHSPHGSREKALAENWMSNHSDVINAVSWNGMFGEEQIKWLTTTLRAARKQDKNVIVFGHHPVVDSDGRMAKHLAWNADEMQELFEKEGVSVYISGHCHQGGAKRVGKVDHLTLEALVDSDERGAHGVLRLYKDKVVLQGSGCMKSRTFELDR